MLCLFVLNKALLYIVMSRKGNSIYKKNPMFFELNLSSSISKI